MQDSVLKFQTESIAASLQLRNGIGERLISHRSVKSCDLEVWGEEEFAISSLCKNYCSLG